MQKYISLMRLDKPIGFMLLFWPCAWGFAYISADHEIDKQWFIYFTLFFLGSILMRSAGCVYNDIIDKKIDQKVARTKSRPLASEIISIQSAWILIFILCLLALLILAQFNFKAILFGLSSSILILLYPFMKRITFWPQLFLGIVFNWGVLLSWLVFNDTINLSIILLYISAVLWTLGYDTIYGLQDSEDDIKIGVKSTAIKFGEAIKSFITTVYFFSFLIMLISAYLVLAKFNLMISFFLIPFLLLIYQILHVSKNNSQKNLSLFKLNNYYGLSIFIIQILVFHNA